MNLEDEQDKVPEGWLPPKWTEELHQELIDAATFFSEERGYNFRKLAIRKPRCNYQIRTKYVMIPDPRENCFKSCGEPAEWWHPVSDRAYCNEHIDNIVRPIFYRAWRQARLELLHYRMVKAGLIK